MPNRLTNFKKEVVRVYTHASTFDAARTRVLAGGRVPARELGIDVAAPPPPAVVDLWTGDMVIVRVDESDAALDELVLPQGSAGRSPSAAGRVSVVSKRRNSIELFGAAAQV